MEHKLARLRTALAVGALTLTAATAGFALVAGPAQAVGTVWYVATNGNDSGDCNTPADPCESLAEVIFNRAENNDIIQVAAGTYEESDLQITYNLTIVGAPGGGTRISDNDDRTFYIFGEETSPTVTLQNLDISGNASGDGVDVYLATVNFVDSHVDDNNYGVYSEFAAIHATGSTFSRNGSDESYADGIYLRNGALTAEHSTFDGNSGAGVWVDALNLEREQAQPDATNGAAASAVLDQSTVSNNGDAGVGSYDASLQIWSSTLSANTGAGIELRRGRSQFGVAEVRNSTITGTKAPQPITPQVVEEASGGILTGNDLDDFSPQARADARARMADARSDASPRTVARVAHRIAAATDPVDLDAGEVAVSSSIIASQAEGVPDCAISPKFIVDDGYNDSSDADNSCGFSTDANDLVSTDPLLGPLADNGGPTLTHTLLKGSPAIDVVPAGQVGCEEGATDQRDLPRVQPTGGKCDVGAVELAANPLTIHPNSLPDGTVGEPYSATVTATGGQYPSYTWALADGSLPPGLSFADTGDITGTPTTPGSFTFTVSVNDPVLKTYTIVIAAPSTPTISDGQTSTPTPQPTDSDGGVANTGAQAGQITTLGLGAVLAGFLILCGAALIGRRPGRHRA